MAEETLNPESANNDATEATTATATTEAATEAPQSTSKAAATSSARSSKSKSANAESAEAKPASASEEGASKSSNPFSLDAEADKPKIIKAKGSKNVSVGIVHVLSTFNNTSVTITDLLGQVIGWSSAGKAGFKGSRKSTAYAAQMAAQDACRQAMGHGLREVEVRVKGPGAGRESAVRAVQAIGLEISTIRDVTPVPHNGCRPPKQRRV